MTGFTESLTEKLTAALIAEGAQMLAMTAFIAVLLVLRRGMNSKFTAKSRFAVWKITIISLCVPLALAVFCAPQIGSAASSVRDIIRPDTAASSDGGTEEDVRPGADMQAAQAHDPALNTQTPVGAAPGVSQSHISGNIPPAAQASPSGGQQEQTALSPVQVPSAQDGAQSSAPEKQTGSGRFSDAFRNSASAVLDAGRRAGDVGRSITASTAGRLAAVMIAFIITAAAVTVLLSRIGVYCFYIRRLRRMERLGIIRPADGRTMRVYRSVCRELEIPESKAPRLMFAPKSQGAMLCGIIRPTVLIPELDLLIKGNEAGLRAVLSHELIHFKRGDIRTQLLCLVALSMHWYNPAVRSAASQCIAELELSCDELVTSGFSNDDRISYGETVIAILRSTAGAKAPLLAQLDPRTGKEKRRAVKERFMNIFDTTKKRRGRGIIALSLAACMTSGTLVACASVGAVIKKDTPVFDREENYLVPSYIVYYGGGFSSKVQLEYEPAYNTYAKGDDGKVLTDADGNRIADLGRITTSRTDRGIEKIFATETAFGRNETTEDIGVRHSVFQYGADGSLIPNRKHESDSSGSCCYSYRYGKNFWKTVNSGYTDEGGLLHKVSVTEHDDFRSESDLTYKDGKLAEAKTVMHDPRSSNDITENITFEFDKEGRPVAKKTVMYEGNDLSTTLVSSASYGDGIKITETKEPYRNVTYSYDERGRLFSVALSSENGMEISKNYTYGSGAYATAYSFKTDGEEHDSGNFDEETLTSRFNSGEIVWRFADEQVYTMYRQLCGLSCMPAYADTGFPEPDSDGDIMYLFSIPYVLFADQFGTIFDFSAGDYIQYSELISDIMQAMDMLPGYITDTSADISEEDANRAVYYCQLMAFYNFVNDPTLDYLIFTEEQLKNAVTAYLGPYGDKLLKYDLKKNDAWNESEGVYKFPIPVDYWHQDQKHKSRYSDPKIKISEQDGIRTVSVDTEIYEGGGIYSETEKYIGNFRYVFRCNEKNGKTTVQLVSAEPTGKKDILQHEELKNGSKYEVSKNPNGTYNFFVCSCDSDSTFSETNLVHIPHIERLEEHEYDIFKICLREDTGVSDIKTAYFAAQKNHGSAPEFMISDWYSNVVGECGFDTLTLDSDENGSFIVQHNMFDPRIEHARIPYDNSDMADSELPISKAEMTDKNTVRITYTSKSTGSTVTSTIKFN